ncbi:MAG: DNA-directed RNA polymerase subunit P [Candidatus Marsarchaeota archaeon]|jgi:DNA-directed RNA polymerase subunit RPC12/RpoP|nr:DNA-directed RNA polymerase subunit P [Candidatus Marsarchaeota archaeon]
MGYMCAHCKKEIKVPEKNSTRCPYCGYRVLAKKRSSLAKEVSTK